jgi:hypothetical protein
MLAVFECFGFTAPSRYQRLGSLFMHCLTCEQFRDDIIAADPILAFAGDFGFATTCIMDVPENKAHRGILKMVSRTRLDNGKYKIVAQTPFHPGRYSAMLTKWLTKDAHKLMVA